MSPKLKSPRTWTEGGGVVAFIHTLDLLKLTSQLLNFYQEVDTNLATKSEFLFVNTLTQTDSESFSTSVMGIFEISLWMSNITLPPLEFLSFLYTLYG